MLRSISPSRRPRVLWNVVLATLALLLCWEGCGLPMHAQNPRGTLRGEVQDATGARIAGARVVVQSRTSSLSSESASNERGEFRIEGLLPGAYHVTVTAPKFAEAS